MTDEVKMLIDAADRARDSGNYKVAFEIWHELASTTSDPVHLCKAAAFAHHLRRWAQAEDLLLKVIEIRATPLALGSLSVLFLNRTDGESAVNATAALHWAERAIAAGPSRIVPASTLLDILGFAQNRLKNRGAAKDAFSKAIQANQENEEAHYNLGSVLVAEGNLEEAEARFRNAIALDPNFGKAHSALGVMLYKRGLIAEAKAELSLAIDLDPSDDTGTFYLDEIEATEDTALIH